MHYKISNTSSAVVTCTLNQNEKLVTESGVSVQCSANINSQTSRDIRFSKAFLQKLERKPRLSGLRKSIRRFSATMERLLTGSSVFHNVYSTRDGQGTVTFMADYAGSVIAVQVDKHHHYIVQKGGFLAAEKGVRLCSYTGRLKDGFFGEGIFLQKLVGHGTAFIQAEGDVREYCLHENEQLIMEPGLLVVMDDSCTISSRRNKSLKSVFMGGKNLYDTVITGPGTVYVQV